jgi:SPP1 gp7 family putative phage head morphogenesis protein
MYRQADKLLEQLKKLIRREFNRLGILGFDELNAARVTRETIDLYDRMKTENKKRYLEVAKKAYAKAVALAIAAGYEEPGGNKIDEAWIIALLGAYNFVSGYLYESEADRKRLRLAEQMMTAREYLNRTLYNDSVRRSANLWWTQTSHYMLESVDNATVEGYKDSGVEKVEWHTNIDGRECKTCRERNGKIFAIDKIPPKPHRNCRCYCVPVPNGRNRQESR